MTARPTTWVGHKDQGHWQRGYSRPEYDTVVSVMHQFVGPQSRTTMEALTHDDRLKGIPPRTVRQILSDADGVDFVLALDDRGDGVIEAIYVCDRREQAQRTTQRFRDAATAYQTRVDRRESFVQHLPGTEPGRLF